MDRTVISKKDIATQQIRDTTCRLEMGAVQEMHLMPSGEADKYTVKLMKYIPTEVIAVYITLEALVRSSADMNHVLYWIVFMFGIIVTPFYLWKVEKVLKKLQLLISTMAFIIWVFAMGGPFTYVEWYDPLYGAVLLIMYTFFIPIIEA